ncbi:hypothetical protein [Listeria floridensis]|uniref:hypothetical protein n=1 Tax=Listeria floridensis TaxID=1494962 RepID=UPI0004B31ECA|nr:hypothetical protein [Listeria floridensis]
MGLAKLMRFYHQKLGNWNLIYSFMKGSWISYILLVILLILGTAISFVYVDSGISWLILGAAVLFGVLFFLYSDLFAR